ncbi:HNH endonuclease [Loktanella agnita]|uniref:HNH endonuclease n=1 Tax=Loktanella agnita TaxID=287097 RepID=UPI003986CB91
MTVFDDLWPAENYRMMDLVSQAGFDVSDWENFKGGARKAATNPKYCYEWVFVEDEKIIVNLWYEELSKDKSSVRSTLAPLSHPSNKRGIRKLRARRMYHALTYCYEFGILPRVIILRRSERNAGSVGAKQLDNSVWTVTLFNREKGEFTLERGRHNTPIGVTDPDLAQFREGEVRYAFVKHRSRERELRRRKIENFIREHGHVFCEVPSCGFDFHATYGEIGKDYAHVHHLTPLSQVPDVGVSNNIKDLQVVCPNCHAMIHIGGECRPIESLISRKGNGDVF